MKKYLIIKGDTNDADYVMSKDLVDDETIEMAKRVVNEIEKSKQRHNWNISNYNNGEKDPTELYKDVLEESDIDWFNEYVPGSEDGIHTIVSVDILVVAEEIKLL